MSTWFNKKTASSVAKLASNLKSESRARAEAERKLKAEIESKAEMERKIKAEAEKMLLAQFDKYNCLVERAETKADKAISEARARVREAEERVLAYEVELAQTQERLNEAKDLMKNQAIARAKAEESLQIESEERRRVEAELEDVMAIAKVKAHEEVQPYAKALTGGQEKPIETKEQAETKYATKTRKSLKAEIKKRRKEFNKSIEEVHEVKRTRRQVIDPGNLKRKFTLLLVTVIFSAITFALSVDNDPSIKGSDGSKMKESPAVEIAFAENDTDTERLKSDVKTELSIGSLRGPEPDMTNAPANYKSEDNITEAGNIPVLNTKTVTITASPASLKITASERNKNDIVRFSDNNRLETRAGSDIYFEFSDVSMPADAEIKSAVLFVEHFEEERFAQGKLEWIIGMGLPGKPVIWAAMKAPVHEGQSSETVDAWDITSVADSVERINFLQLQIKNNNDVVNGKTFVDYAYVVIEYH
ncbi:MAG: hypothetical protein JW837_16885 [Sedimentisphaerales bacterium]|nr:hypothetical protein [Sedimentisphaerales bacterium]